MTNTPYSRSQTTRHPGCTLTEVEGALLLRELTSMAELLLRQTRVVPADALVWRTDAVETVKRIYGMESQHCATATELGAQVFFSSPQGTTLFEPYRHALRLGSDHLRTLADAADARELTFSMTAYGSIAFVLPLCTNVEAASVFAFLRELELDVQVSSGLDELQDELRLHDTRQGAFVVIADSGRDLDVPGDISKALRSTGRIEQAVSLLRASVLEAQPFPERPHTHVCRVPVHTPYWRYTLARQLICAPSTTKL